MPEPERSLIVRNKTGAESLWLTWLLPIAVVAQCYFSDKFNFFWFTRDVLHYLTMILQRILIIVEDVGFEPGTSAPEVW